MTYNFIDIEGEIFNYLTVVRKAHYRVSEAGNKTLLWECKCTCGNICFVSSRDLRTNHTKSCGCMKNKMISDSVSFKRENVHKPTLTTWSGLITRCYNTRCKAYPDYGGIGVTICDRWLVAKGGSFENFLEDMGERPDNTTLNRINGAKIYSKETCEWATRSVQAYDQRKKKANTSGRTGVSWSKDNKKWRVRINFQNKAILIGDFFDKESAIAAREKAELFYFGFTKE